MTPALEKHLLTHACNADPKSLHSCHLASTIQPSMGQSLSQALTMDDKSDGFRVLHETIPNSAHSDPAAVALHLGELHAPLRCASECTIQTHS